MEVFAGFFLGAAILLAAWPKFQERLWSSHLGLPAFRGQRASDNSIFSRVVAALGAEENDKICRQAGRPGGLNGSRFVAYQWSATIGATTFFALMTNIPFAVLIGGFTWFMARIWLRSKAEARIKQINLELPSFLDLWGLLVTSGEHIEGALGAIYHHHPEWIISQEMRLVLDKVAVSSLLGEALVLGARETGSAELVNTMEQVRQLVEGGGSSPSKEFARIAKRLRDEHMAKLVDGAGVAAILGVFPKFATIFLALAPMLGAIFIDAFSQF